VGVTANYAVVELGTQTLAVGDQARLAEVGEVEQAHDPTVHVGAAQPIGAYQGQWPDATLPAEEQSPDFVPLGTTGGNRRYDAAFSTSGTVVAPLSGTAQPIFRGDLRARVYAEPFDGLPLWVRGDVAGQLWVADDLDQRQGGDARPYLRVRELAVGGKSDDQIRAFLTERYGDFVLYNPPVKRTTWLLWFGPFVLLAGGALMWWKIGRSAPSPDSGTRDSPLRDDDVIAAARGQALLDAPLPESPREPRRAAPGSRSPARR
jgi:hypothetical protein